MFEGIILTECDHCPWLNNPPKNVDASVLAIIGNIVGGLTGSRTCGVCGCNLKAKSMMGLKCPLEDSSYNTDPEVNEWREDKWNTLEESMSEREFEGIKKMRFER